MAMQPTTTLRKHRTLRQPLVDSELEATVVILHLLVKLFDPNSMPRAGDGGQHLSEHRTGSAVPGQHSAVFGT
jgi:hypothetical protein